MYVVMCINGRIAPFYLQSQILIGKVNEMQPKVGYVKQSVLKANGIMDDAVRFVLKNQLKDRVLWGKFNVFTRHAKTPGKKLS